MSYYRKNLIVLWIATLLVSASWTQIVPFLPQFVAELGAGEAAAQWSGIVFSMHSLSAIVMMPVWGKLADRVGRKPILIRAGLFLSAIFYMTSLSTQAWHLALARFLNGALTGFIPMAVTLVSTNTPREFTSRYVASVHTGIAVGTVAGPLLGSVLSELFGIRNSFRISSLAVLLVTLSIIAFVEERHPPAPQGKTRLLADLREAVRFPTLPSALLIALIGAVGQLGPQPVLSLHIEELLGTSSGAATGIAYSLPGIALVVSSHFWVSRAERRGALTTAVTAMLGAGLSYIALGVVDSFLLFIILFFVNALFVSSLRPISAASVASGVDPDFRGRAFGLHTSSFTLGGLIGPLLAGTIGGLRGYQTVFFAFGGILLLGALLLARTRNAEKEPSAAR